MREVHCNLQYFSENELYENMKLLFCFIIFGVYVYIFEEA